MNTEEAIITRRAIKHFDPEHMMSEEEINKLISLASASPTAFNLQHWRFVLVEDKQLRKEIRKHAWDQTQVTDASLLIILCANLNTWKNNPAQYWQGAPKEVQEFMMPAIDDYYRDKNQVQRDEAMRSCGIAAQTLMLSAKSMGYDSCPMDGFDFEQVARIIKLPKDHIITMFVTIGKGTKSSWPKPGQLNLDEITIKNTF
jgi:nitroreductase